MPKVGYLGMIFPLWPPNRLSYLEGSLRTWRNRHLNRFLNAPLVLFLKENIGERVFLNINPVVGTQTPQDLSPISMGITQKTGIFVPQRDVSKNLRMHKLVENSDIGPRDPFSCLGLRDTFLQTPFQKFP